MSLSSVSNTSMVIEWEAPLIAEPVIEYLIWVKFDKSSNAYQTPLVHDDDIDLPHELTPASTNRRLTLPSSSRSFLLSGDFIVPSLSTTHSISPWTYYRIFIAPVTSAYTGAPASLTVLTFPV